MSRGAGVGVTLVALELVDYQSHERTRLELGSLTVIVGSSSSGKSAVLRALTTLVTNSRGTSYVRHGARLARVSAVLVGSDPVSACETRVTVLRSRDTSAYELARADDAPVCYTKCGTATPAAVTAALGFGGEADTGLWLAGQFDRPYLLDQTGSQVARVLGNLTGVSLLFAASRECARRASATRVTLKERRGELEEVTAAVERHRDLPQRLAACSAAQEALSVAQRAAQRRDRLAALVAEQRSVAARIVELQSRIRPVPDVAVLVEIARRHTVLAAHLEALVSARRQLQAATQVVASSVDVSSLLVQVDRSSVRQGRLATLVAGARAAGESVVSAREALQGAVQQAQESRERLGDALHRLGSCPLCGAEVEYQHPERVG